MINNKKIIFFRSNLNTTGGAERVMLEETLFSDRYNSKTHVLTFDFNPDIFNGAYKYNTNEIGYKKDSNSSRIKNALYFTRNILALRNEIKKIQPDIIISSNIDSCCFLYFATLFTKFIYVTHIHLTFLWGDSDILKYAYIYRKALKNAINGSVHKGYISNKKLSLNLINRLSLEINAIITYLSVRKAKMIFVWSNEIAGEVKKLYGKNSIVLRGAFASEMIGYNPKIDFKHKLCLDNKQMILNVNRLADVKRVDLVLRAFKLISDKRNDLFLVVGGDGPEKERLKNLVINLKIEDRVIFVGYISEDDLWDYYCSCDVFVSAERADHDLTLYEILALQKKVVLSKNIEFDETLSKNKHIFTAENNEKSFAKAIEKALNTEVKEFYNLSNYTYDEYVRKLCENLNLLF